METRFSICDKVWYLNTASGSFEEAEVKSVRIIPTAMSKGMSGENVLDSAVVLYETVDGPVLAETEVFGSRAEALEFWRGVLAGL